MGSTSSVYRFSRGHTSHQRKLGTWHQRKLGTWAEAAVPKLEDVASRYGAIASTDKLNTRAVATHAGAGVKGRKA